MTKDEGMTKIELPNGPNNSRVAGWDFEASGLFRHWTFVIRISVGLTPAGKTALLWADDGR